MINKVLIKLLRFSLFALLVLSSKIFASDDGINITKIIALEADSNNHRVVYYDIAVLNNAGWQQIDIERAITKSKAIYAQCNVHLEAQSIRWLDTPQIYLNLNESNQADIIEQLPASRPLVVFIQQTTDGDNAYSYLLSAPLSSQGSAWITRKSSDECTGVLMAHELGHILLDTDSHAADIDNLMAYSCTHSNIQGAKPNTDLTPEQCAKLQNSRATIKRVSE